MESQLVLRPTGLTFASRTPLLSRKFAAACGSKKNAAGWDGVPFKDGTRSRCSLRVWCGPTCIGHWDECGSFHCGTRVHVFFINSRRQSFGDGVSERWQIDLTDTVPQWVCYITSLDVGRVGLFETMQFRSNESADLKCG